MLRGDVNIPAFQNAWQFAINRHPILRTTFAWADLQEPLQIVHRQVNMTVDVHDWRNLTEIDKKRKLHDFLRTDRELGFDFTKPPLMRWTLLRMSPESYRFIWSSHHLLMDGWSEPTLLREVFAAYAAYSNGDEVRLSPVRSYRQYIEWLREQDLSKAEQFWRKKLRGFTAPTTISHPGYQHASSESVGGYKEASFSLSQQETEALKAFVRVHCFTPNILFQAVWATLLATYSGQTDVVFGITVSGRPPALPGVETIVGPFINTLPVRITVPWKGIGARLAKGITCRTSGNTAVRV